MKNAVSPLSYLAGAVLLWLGLRIGHKLPDFDQHTSLLVHRSLLTHGVLVPLGVFLLLRLTPTPTRLFGVGVCLASSVHLCFDLFPRAWRGFALVWAPFYGRTDALFSKIWLFLGAVIGLYVAVLLIRQLLELALSFIALIGSWIQQSADESALVPSLGMLFLSVLIASSLPSPTAFHWRQSKSNSDRQ